MALLALRRVVATVPTTLLDVDFAALALGKMSAGAFLAATRLTFTRSTVSTVQTSDSTIDSTPGVDDACLGDRTASGHRGLVIEHNVQQLLGSGSSPRNVTTSWNGGQSANTYPYADSPDQSVTGCSRVNATSGQYGPYASTGMGTSRKCFSSWQRSKDAASNGGMQPIVNNASIDAGSFAVPRAPSNAWARSVIAKGTNAENLIAPCDARDYTACGGETSRNRDVLVDYMQFQDGNVATEAIATGATRRANDAVSYAAGSSLVTALSRVKFYAKTITKFASSDQVMYDGTGGAGASAAWYLFSWNTTGGSDRNYAKIKDADKKLYVRIAGGTEVVSTNAVAFGMYDVVDWDVQVGNSVASIARYKINGGAWVDLVLPAVNNVPAPSSAPMAVLYNVDGSVSADSGQFPCWLQHLTFFTDAGSPAAGGTIDLTTLPGLTSLYQSSYAGTPWAADVGPAAVSLGSPPVTGTAQNGYVPASYSGGQALSNTPTILSALYGASAGSGFELVWVRTTVADPGAGSERSGTGILDDSGATAFGLYFFTGFAAFCLYDGSSSVHARAACATGAYHLIQYRYDSTSVECRVDGGAWTALSCGAPANLTSVRRFGQSWLGNSLDGSQLASASANAKWSDAQFTSILAAVNARYGLAL